MKIGIFGGSFNPPHCGHVNMCSGIASALGLEKVIIMPSGVSPHKPSGGLLDGEIRLEMCRLAFTGDMYEISDAELLRQGKSYTFDTLSALVREYPEDELFLLTGSDMLESFDTWYRWQDILSMCTLCAVSREDSAEYEKMRAYVAGHLSRYSERIRLLQLPATRVSSTEIRRAIARGESIEGLVPAAVAEYIESAGLYSE